MHTLLEKDEEKGKLLDQSINCDIRVLNVQKFQPSKQSDKKESSFQNYVKDLCKVQKWSYISRTNFPGQCNGLGTVPGKEFV